MKMFSAFESEVDFIDGSVFAFGNVDVSDIIVDEHRTCEAEAESFVRIRVFAENSAPDMLNEKILIVDINRQNAAGKISHNNRISGIEKKRGERILRIAEVINLLDV